MYQYKHVTPVHIRDSTPLGVYIGRTKKGKPTNIYGNTFPVEIYGRSEAIRLHLEDVIQRLLNSEITVEDILALRGKQLVCFCYPKQCHAENYDKIIQELDELDITTHTEFLQFIQSKPSLREE